MNKQKLSEMIKIADIHASRIDYAINDLKSIFPVAAEDIAHFSEKRFLLIELLINRFAKLQDFLGSKIIDAFLEASGELTTSTLTMIDKINKMEALGIIQNASIWFEMREIRNHLAHEYPDHPENTAKYLNQAFAMTPKLLDFYYTIKRKIDHLIH